MGRAAIMVSACWTGKHLLDNPRGAGTRFMLPRRAFEARRLYMMDIFHTFLDAGSIWTHLLFYVAVYVSAFLFFAIFYFAVSKQCNLQLDSFTKAYYLSMETMVPIGYGVPDPYFNGCWQGTILVTSQSILQFFINALIIGSVFVRLTRPQNCANPIVFSENAAIREYNGALYFMFR